MAFRWYHLTIFAIINIGILWQISGFRLVLVVQTPAPAIQRDSLDSPEFVKTTEAMSLDQDTETSLNPKPAANSNDETASLLLHFTFQSDPSFLVRCKAPKIEVLDSACVPQSFETTDSRASLLLKGPISQGATTSQMVVKPMAEIAKSVTSKVTFVKNTEGQIIHHPVFYKFAEKTYRDKFFQERVVEFNGVHSAWNYDCEQGVDFRMYHQVRAAMCDEHDAHRKSSALFEGVFPVVDEEYFEYIITLTVAYEAATKKDAESKLPFTFIELGARYGTWIARAGAAYRLFASPEQVSRMQLLAVEGNCGWFRKMEEHIECNHLSAQTKLVLGYAAPRSYNKVVVGKPSTYNEPRAISLLDMLPSYQFVHLIDFDIQGFEIFTTEEQGAMDALSEKVGFIHFGTHATDIEFRLLKMFQAKHWVVAYFFAGAHTKKLHKGHKCVTPFGPSGFNDGVLGFANLKFYPHLEKHKNKVVPPSVKSTAASCYWVPEVMSILLRKPLTEESSNM